MGAATDRPCPGSSPVQFQAILEVYMHSGSGGVGYFCMSTVACVFLIAGNASRRVVFLGLCVLQVGKHLNNLERADLSELAARKWPAFGAQMVDRIFGRSTNQAGG